MSTRLTKTRKILAFLARLISRKDTCKYCGMPHRFTKMHITWLGPIGLMALCEDCFQRLEPHDRLPFYMKLRSIWGGPGSADEMNWTLVRRTVLDEKIKKRIDVAH